MNNSNLYNSKKSGLAFSLSAILPVLLSFIFVLTVQIIAALNNAKSGMSVQELYSEYISQNWFIFISFLVSQLCFLLIILYFNRFQGLKIQNIIKGKFNSKYIVIGLLMSFGLIFGLSFVNDYFLKFLKLFGLEPAEITIPKLDTFFNYILAIFIIALLPAVFEEVLFRGIILKGILNLGTVWAVLSCGILFALFHQNPTQTVYQFINGVVFALLAVRAGSIIPTMIMHFVNNAYILTAYYLFPNFEFSGVLKIVIIISALIIFCGSIVYLMFFDKNNKHEKTESGKTFYKYSAFGIVLCALLWIAGLF
jgi:membrane protease YdiL (CAAX protease family)